MRVLCHYCIHFVIPLSTSLLPWLFVKVHQSFLINIFPVQGTSVPDYRFRLVHWALIRTPCIYQPWCERWLHVLRIRSVNHLLCFVFPFTNLEDSTSLNSLRCTSDGVRRTEEQWLVSRWSSKTSASIVFMIMNGGTLTQHASFISAPLAGRYIKDPWSSTLLSQPSQSHRMSADVSPEVYIKSQGLQWVSSRHD